MPLPPRRARLLGECRAAPAARSGRGGGRLRHPRHRARRGLRAVDRAGRSLQGLRCCAGSSRSAMRSICLGSDELGRDMLTRLIYGGRLSLFMGVHAGLPGLLHRLHASGSWPAIVGGALNTLIMRTVDVFYAFPSVLLAIALSGALGAGILNAIVSLTVVFMPPITRVAESVTTQIRSRDYVEAARVSGAGAFTHHPRPCARQRARADLRLCDEPDQRVDDPRLRALVSRPRLQAAGAGMGPHAQHAAHGDLCAADRRGPAGRDDLHHLDLVQPLLRRAALGHGGARD